MSAPPSDVPALARGGDPLERRLRASRHPSAMLERPSWLARLLLRPVFGQVRFERRCVDNITDAAQQATVVYVMQTRSLIDYLYFNTAFLAHKLPLARFANGIRTTLLRPLLALLLALVPRRYPPKPNVLERVVSMGESALIFLQRPTDELYSRHRFSQPFLKRLVEMAAHPKGRRIMLVPLLLTWEKRSESYRKTFFDDVFGSTQSPGPIRKFFHLVRAMWQGLLRAGAPVVQVSSALDLGTFVAENDRLTRSEKAAALDEHLMDVFARERRVIVGPPIKPAAQIRREVIESPRVDRAIQHITRTKPEYPEVVKKQAAKIIKEIAANFSMMTIKILSAVVNPVFDTLYKGIELDTEGIEKVRRTARDSRIVLLPSHKSHIDYLVLSNVFYQHGLMPPHIAAGANLSFWPMGGIFRSAGAFFLRRSFKGDDLYTAIFTEYVIKVLREGFPVEFFVEGTRSRTGKLLRPRYGLLKIIAQAVVDGDLSRIAFVPCSVGYERVVEGRSYEKELMGGEKKAENLSGMLKATRVLRTKYGRVHVEFGEPFLVDDFLGALGIGPQSEPVVFDEAMRRLGYHILGAINAVTTVTPSGLVAMALLASPEREVEQSELLGQTGFLVRYLLRRQARLSRSIRNALAGRGLLPDSADGSSSVGVTAAEAQRPLDAFERNAAVGLALEAVTLEGVQLFVDAGSVKVRTVEGRTTYLRDDEHRLELNFYRNSLVHFVLDDALVATALAAAPPGPVRVADLGEAAVRLALLLKLEFCHHPRSEAPAALERAVAFFVENGWVRRAQDGSEALERCASEPPALGLLRRLLATWLEGYWVAAAALPALLEEPLSAKDFVKLCLRRGKKHHQAQEIRLYEALSKPTFENAVELWKARGILEIGQDEDTRGLLQLAHGWRTGTAHATLLAELEAFLVPRPSAGGPVVAQETVHA